MALERARWIPWPRLLHRWPIALLGWLVATAARCGDARGPLATGGARRPEQSVAERCGRIFSTVGRTDWRHGSQRLHFRRDAREAPPGSVRRDPGGQRL